MMDSTQAAGGPQALRGGSARGREGTAPSRESGTRERIKPRLQRIALGAIALILVQAGIGMYVNLYVTIPTNHPGANPKFSNYLGGSSRSVAWALAHGAPMLVFHATLGILLAAGVIGVAVYAVRLRSWIIGALSVIAGLLVIEAGFKGASFLDFQNDSSSLIMALLAFGAIACYAAILYLLTIRPQSR
jgi:hypothetical protein